MNARWEIPAIVGGMEEEVGNHLTAVDGLVLAMLSTMLLSLCVIGLLIFCMIRNVARRNRQVDELLEEVAETERGERQAAALSEAAKPEAWERPSEWWKS
jgi:heme/copper-type cytochrome/quinol oxidase subunit 2